MAKTKNPDGSTSAEKGTRVVYIDAPSDPEKNRNISATVHPALFDTFIKVVGERKGTGDMNGRKILTDGALAMAIREAVAGYAGYEYKDASDLALTKQRESNKTVQARNIVRTLFSGLRAKLDFDTALTVARGTVAMLDVSLTEQEFADLWDEAAE